MIEACTYRNHEDESVLIKRPEVQLQREVFLEDGSFSEVDLDVGKRNVAERNGSGIDGVAGHFSAACGDRV